MFVQFSSLNNTEIFSDLSPRHKVKVRSNQGMSNSSSSHRANATNGISASGGGGGGGGGVKVAKKYSYDGFDYTFISRLVITNKKHSKHSSLGHVICSSQSWGLICPHLR